MQLSSSRVNLIRYLMPFFSPLIFFYLFLVEASIWIYKRNISMLKQGLANRRIGATSMNAESSRSHCVFTCVVESRSKVALCSIFA